MCTFAVPALEMVKRLRRVVRSLLRARHKVLSMVGVGLPAEVCRLLTVVFFPSVFRIKLTRTGAYEIRVAIVKRIQRKNREVEARMRAILLIVIQK